jgi:hypothetical protein
LDAVRIALVKRADGIKLHPASTLRLRRDFISSARLTCGICGGKRFPWGFAGKVAKDGLEDGGKWF